MMWWMLAASHAATSSSSVASGLAYSRFSRIVAWKRYVSCDTIPISSIYTGVDKFTTHLKSPDFFNLEANPNAVATYKSTKVTKVDEDSLKVDGDLTINGVTKPVTLDVTVNKIGEHPMTKAQAAGFDATTTIKRSEFNLGYAVPNVGDEVTIEITTEAQKAKAADATQGEEQVTQ